MTATYPTVSIRTAWNQRPIKSTPETRRVLVNGRWKKIDEKAAIVFAWLKGAN